MTEDEKRDIPKGVKGWSWGAFFLTWIWGIPNRVWISLLAFIPFVNIIIAILLGIKGREWAWKAKNWDNLELFNKYQRRWSIAGWVVFIFFIIFSFSYPQYKKLEHIESKSVHYYSYHKGNIYGYEEKISKEDLYKGKGTSKMILAKLLADNGVNYKISIFDSIGSSTYSIIECKKPCKFAEKQNYYDGDLVSENIYPVKKHTVLWAILQDAMNGKLVKNNN